MPVDEGDRIATLHSYDILDTEPEASFDSLTKLAATICGTPMALMTLVDESRQWFKSSVGLGLSETPRDIAFCAHTILDDDLLEVVDTYKDERFHDNPLVSAAPHIRYYAGAPLVVPTGQKIGTLCVLDRKPRQLSEEQKQALVILAQQVIAELELRKAVRQLADQSAFQRSLLDNAGAAFIVTTREGTITQCNPAAERMLGYSADELLEKQVPELFHGHSEPGPQGAAQNSSRGGYLSPEFNSALDNVRRGKHERRQWACTRKDGTRLQMLLNVTAIRDHASNITGILCIGHELPEHATLSPAPAFSQDAPWQVTATSPGTYWQRILLIAGGYVVLAAAALSLSIPTGYSVPFWPAAGLSVGVLFVWGLRHWPGVLLGILVYESFQGHLLYGEESISSTLLVTAGAALGSTLQATTGAYLARWYWSGPTALARERDVLGLFLVAGPAACLISPTLGVGALWWSERLNQSEIWVNWLVWWAGDSIGVALFMPLVMLVLPQSRHALGDRLAHIAVPILTTAVLATGSLIWLEANADAFKRHYTNTGGEEIAAALETQLLDEIQAISALERFFSSSEIVTREEFASFLHSAHGKGSIERAAWLPSINHGDRARFERAARTDGQPDFEIRVMGPTGSYVPADDRPTYYPIRLVEPLPSNRDLLGLDLGSDVASVQALNQARDTGQLAATGQLSRKATGSPNINLFVAVYQPGFDAASATVEQRRRALQGYVMGGVDLGKTFADTLRLAQRRGFELRVVDQTADGPASLLFASPGMSAKLNGGDWSKTLDFNGRQWRVDVLLTKPELVQGFAAESPLFLPGVVIIVLLITTFTLASAGRDLAISRAVTQRTIELSEQIEARQAIEADLRLAKEDSEAASHAKSLFLASMSHEIRTPLNGVVGNLELLSLTRLNNEQLELVDGTERAAKSLLALIANVLDFARVESEKISFEFGDFDISATLAEAVHVLQSQARLKGLRVAATVEPDVPKLVNCDEMRVRQILLNLIGNALKFTAGGGVRIVLGVTGWDGAVCNLRFDVHDSGPGFTPAEAAKLFQPFVQNSTQLRTEEGAGLGLAISQKLVEQLGGKIGCQGIAGQGATFWFTLPVRVVTHAGPVQAADLSGRTAALVPATHEAAAALENYFRSRGAAVAKHENLPDLLSEMQSPGDDKPRPDIVVCLSQSLPAFSEDDLRDLCSEGCFTCVSGPQVSERTHCLALKSGFGALLPTPLTAAFLDLNVATLIGRLQAVPRRTRSPLRHAGRLLVSGTPARILVLEDRDANAVVIRKQLHALGAECTLVRSGKEGLRATQDNRFDAILCDCSMPEMDGYEFTRALRRQEEADGNTHHTPVIALTANAFREGAQQCFDAGMDDFISKPVNLDRIAAVLEKWLHLPSETAVVGLESIEASDSTAPIDLEILAQVFGTDDRSAIVDTLLEFPSAAKEALAEVRAAISTGSSFEIIAAAHGAKGEAQCAAATTLANMYEEVQNLAKSADYEGLESIERMLAHEVDRVYAFVREIT